MSSTSQKRAAALMEVLGVYLAGPILMLGLRRLFGISLPNPLNTLTVKTSDPGLVIASRQLFLLLLIQNAGYYVFAAPLNWWYRRRRPADYGLTRAGRTWTLLILAGLATAALFEWPVVAINFHPGPTVAWRQAFFDMSWHRWQFWLFAGVLSWAGAPFFEEIFARGYCQRRLAEDWGDGPAIIGAACLFTFSHSQYLMPDAYNVGMILGLLLSAIGFGAVFAWTRSLIPAMIAHAVFDIPMTKPWQTALVAAMLIGSILVWRRSGPILKEIFSTGSLAASLTLGVVAAVYAVLNSVDQIIVYVVAVAFGMLILAAILEAKDRARGGTTDQFSVGTVT
jgi:membrane protease YdiL (CAAX protease family)